MNKQAKLHTIELTENELAKVLFVMRNTNGRNHGRCITSIALEALGAKDIDSGALHSKAIKLARTADIPTFLNYYEIQKEWEEFLGIGRIAQGTLDRIAELEKELAELKGLV